MIINRAYIAVGIKTYNHRKQKIVAICKLLKSHNIEPMVFIEHYRFEKDQCYEMMQTAMAEIDQADVLIAEVTEKAIGVGVEVGYAKARGKTIIQIRSIYGNRSSTIQGMSDYCVNYGAVDELLENLNEVIVQILGK